MSTREIRVQIDIRIYLCGEHSKLEVEKEHLPYRYELAMDRYRDVRCAVSGCHNKGKFAIPMTKFGTCEINLMKRIETTPTPDTTKELPF